MGKRARHLGLFELSVHRAMSDALYQKLLDESWEELRAVLDEPKVKEARKRFLRLFAEALARRDGGNGR